VVCDVSVDSAAVQLSSLETLIGVECAFVCVYKDKYALKNERLVTKKNIFLVTRGKKGIKSKKKKTCNSIE